MDRSLRVVTDGWALDRVVAELGGMSVTGGQLLVVAGAALLLLALAILLKRGATSREAARDEADERHDALQAQMSVLARSSAELSGRMQSVAEVFGSRQADLARHVADRLDAVGTRLGQGLDASSRSANESLGRLNERLAVIDAAQGRLVGLTQEVLGLKEILANKQARGAFGQGRMEAIIRDALPASAYVFQPTLSNRSRPDCGIRLPGDDRLMVVDAKFPLEAFAAVKAASALVPADAAASKAAAARVRADVGRHIKDIADKYLLPGETQDIAILFVPSESLYAEINEVYEDVVGRAHKARIIIVSPSLLMMAVQVMQAIVRDARVREQAHVIQSEVRHLLADVGRLHERLGKLGGHFRQANDDVAGALTSAEKIMARGERIDAMDFVPASSGGVVPFAKAAE